MRATAYRFLPGHRIRLSVASSYWPVVWPSPFAAEYAPASRRRRGRGSRLVLPRACRPTPRRCRCRRSRRPRPASARLGERPLRAAGLADRRGRHRRQRDGRTSSEFGETDPARRPDVAVQRRAARDDRPRRRPGPRSAAATRSSTGCATATRRSSIEASGTIRQHRDRLPHERRPAGHASTARRSSSASWLETIPRRLV